MNWDSGPRPGSLLLPAQCCNVPEPHQLIHWCVWLSFNYSLSTWPLIEVLGMWAETPHASLVWELHEILKNIVHFDKLKMVPSEHKRGCLILGRTEVGRGSEVGLEEESGRVPKCFWVSLQTHTPEQRRSLGDGFRDSLSLLAERPQCFHWLSNCPLWLEHIGALGLWKSVSVRDSIGPQKTWLFPWPALVTW